MKNRLTHNLGMKIVSVIVAALLWLTIMNMADPVVTETFDNIPVQIINDEVITSRGYQYSVESGDTVAVKVKGQRSVVDNLTLSDFVATVDFNSLNAMYMATISVECTSDNAKDLTLTLRNETMAVKLEDQETQPFNVRIVQQGTVKEGYYCYESRVSSTLVQVTGSITQMQELKEIVATVDVEGKSSSFTADCGLTAYDMNGTEIDLKRLSFSQDTVSVSIGICPTREVPITVEVKNEPASGYYAEEKVEYAPATVTIAAEEELLRTISSIVIPCDIEGAKSSIDRQVDLAEFVSLHYDGVYLTGESEYVGIIVTVNKMAERSIELSEQDIEARNLGENLECTIYSMWNSKVLVRGPEAELADITAADIGLYIDLSGCVAGNYSRQLKCDYDGILEIDTGTVMVKLDDISPVIPEDNPDTDNPDAE